MSNIEKLWMWSKTCIEGLYVEACQRNHDAVATMLLGGDPA